MRHVRFSAPFLIFYMLLIPFQLRAQTTHFTEGFENPNDWSGYTSGSVTFPSGAWEFVSVFPDTDPEVHAGSRAARINDDTQGASVTTPSINSAGKVSFFYHRPFSGTGTFQLQRSVNDGPFETLASVTFTDVTNPTLYQFEINDARDNIRIRVVNDNNSAHLTLDEFSVTTYEESGVPEAPSDLAVADSTVSTIDLSWQRNAQQDSVLLAFATSQITAEPTSETRYRTGETIGNAEVLYTGVDAAFSHSNLTSGTRYHYKIWSYSDTLTYSAGITTSGQTLKGEPADYPANFQDSERNSENVTLTWNDVTSSPLPDGYLVRLFTSQPDASVTVSDGTNPFDVDDAVVITQGRQQAYFGELTPEATYYFRIIPFTNRGGDTDYKTDGSAPTLEITTPEQNLFEEIAGGLVLDPLVTQLRSEFSVSSSQGYDQARELLYGNIDLSPYDSLEGIYSDYTIKMELISNPRSEAFGKDINAEHTWPQSFGARNEPMRSDMHHLFPSKVGVNADRGNLPFAEILDSSTDRWYYRDQELSAIPAASIINRFSEWQSNTAFEPREAKKGDVARAIFYFWTTYQTDSEVSANEPFFDGMKQTLYNWHRQDPPDFDEVARSREIAAVQGNRNPFVHDTSLVRRAYFYDNSVSNEKADEQVKRFHLGHAYPNPFNPSTIIPFQMGRAGEVRISVYDILGREVRTLFNERVPAGTHSVTFDGNGLNSGLYLIYMQTAGVRFARQVTLIK